jgi:gamma-D-glutamyl-L-lysine dipeptidyl-peptidase
MTLNFKILLFALLIIITGKNSQAQNQSFKSLANEIQTVQKQLVPDKRTAILEISLNDTINRIITVKGETNLSEAKSLILQLLSEKNIRFTDSIRVLPDASLGDKIWGLATLSVSNMRARPDDAAELVSQALMGTPMKVLDYLEGWYKVQTPENYIGWMGEKELQRITESQMELWRKSNRYFFNRINGNVYRSPDKKKTVISDLVLGDLFEVEAEVKGFLKMRFPDGRTGFVKKKDCISWNDLTSQKPDIHVILQTANQMMGIPYLWGGASAKSMDCSGLTKIAYFSQGIILARDASQQSWYGEHPDFSNYNNLQPGDLLFFGRNAQRVTHVGIYMGKEEYLNASGCVRINSLDPKDPRYKLTEKKNLVAASRIINSLNTEGIVLVKDHAWYSLP